ncbi:MAG TPA: L,D-transpeptidase family protein [Polyangiaceae bacterium]|nr:L,D-transpeptidase family protein [Polyangiaceae bacterium]
MKLTLAVAVLLVGCRTPQPIEHIEPPAAAPVAMAPPITTLLPTASASEVQSGPLVRPFTLLHADYDIAAAERSRRAHLEKSEIVRDLFERAGVSLPPAQFLLRAYKQERELEVWAASSADEPLVHVTTYAICAASGELGPKRREGDQQVPEGFYKIEYLWPDSDFYLAMKVGYPNVSDKILGNPTAPGGDIMIHGACASIGCLAMSDERIQELWVMASHAQKRGRIHVHIFPTRDPASLTDPRHEAFWNNIYEGHALFEQSHRLADVRIDHHGRYHFAPPTERLVR